MKKLRLVLLKLLNGISKEQHDKECAKLGAIIEQHIDDETWLLRKLGIQDHYKYRKGACMLVRELITNKLGE